MKKLVSALAIGSMLFLTACNQSGEAPKKMTAEDLFEKSEKAMEESLKSIHSTIVYDEYAATIYDGDVDNPEKAGVKYTMNIDGFLDPVKMHVKSDVSPLGEQPYTMDLYQLEDRMFLTDNLENKWEELPSDALEELFGTIVSDVYPIIDLSKFKEFKDDFVLEPIEYGYALKLSIDRDEFKRFKEVFPEIGPSKDGFTMVERLELVIKFDKKTSYVTGFNLISDIKNYSDSNSYRSRQKLNATYSYFNDIEDFTLPTEVSKMAAE